MTRFLTMVAGLVALALAGTVRGAATAPQAPPKVESGYTSLFNGKDLTGWKVGGADAAFSVVDGAIQANGAPNAAHLFYDGPVMNHMFKDFDLRLDVMAKNKSNGGIYICTTFQPTGFPQQGFEVQVNNSHTDRVRTASLYHVVDLSYIPAKDDEWFPMEIMVKGQTITIWVKHNKVVEWTQPADWTTNYDTKERHLGTGTIAFQAHDPNSFTYYKNIRIKGL
jgi:3-keto-disaccharide hydrolase